MEDTLKLLADQNRRNARFSPNIIIFIEKDSSFTQSDDGPMLYISLFTNGIVNRYGSIDESFREPRSDSEYNSTVLIGDSADYLYYELLAMIPKEFAELDRFHWIFGQEDAPYHLYISIYEVEEEGTVIDYYYNSEDKGPPNFLREFVRRADILTHNWDKGREAQQQKKELASSRKAWWKFWA
jgi:hypothetical protein